jgi:CspA family cold shock protein
LATGSVLQFDQIRGYGFVAADDGGDDIFLHASVFDGDPDELAPGTRIEFGVMAGDRGRKAFAAHLVDGDPNVDGDSNRAAEPAEPPRAIAGSEPEEEQLCDVLSPVEFGRELTELLISTVPELTGQQIVQIRLSMLEFAKKHGWSDG